LLVSKGYAPSVDLVSTPEIAVMLGVSRQRVDQLTRMEGFPEPAAELAIGRVWERADVEAWARETGRL
jgi:predicted DNA-binding transcriptional regulator AlpA